MVVAALLCVKLFFDILIAKGSGQNKLGNSSYL